MKITASCITWQEVVREFSFSSGNKIHCREPELYTVQCRSAEVSVAPSESPTESRSSDCCGEKGENSKH